MNTTTPASDYFENKKFAPEDIVVSPKFGIGKMCGVEHISGMESFFYAIESVDQKMKNLIPVDSDILIRKVSSKQSFTRSLEKIGQGDFNNDYESRKDRIAQFQKRIRSNQVTLGTILSVIREIYLLKDKGTVERQMMNELLDTVSKEYAFVFDCDVEEARKMIKKKLNNKKVLH